MNNEFRHLPSVDKLISEERIRQLQEIYPHTFLVELIRRHLEQERLSIAAGNPCPSIDEIVASICAQAHALETPSLRPIINAAAKGYCNLEFNLESGRRGSRTTHIELLLCQLTGAEAALVVNNNASAVLLGLTALAKRKEVIVSRGQAIEIGGGFRIPDVMRQSGAKLVEVGTTNCTYAADYEQAISPQTAALLRVHSSNFRIMGFTHWVTLDELVTLGRQYDLPVLDDLGSGCFLDTTKFGLDPIGVRTKKLLYLRIRLSRKGIKL